MKKSSIVGLLIGLTALLVIPFHVLKAGEESKDVEKIEFVGANKCKMCHNLKKFGMFHDDWMQTKHAKAMDVLNEDEKKNPECLKCHTTGYGKPGGFVSLEKTPALAGVQCEMCHGPGQEHIKSKRGGTVIPHAWEPEEETCVKCHNKENPNWKEDRYTDPETGTKAGFIYKVAVKEINHAKVLEQLGKKTKTADLK
ncbi:MAG TPA: cytochrome c family protein [bacterium]|nr:cytochrome c family protein [bacterium]HOL93932.1 cytochrome c family protein [bacterium]HPP00312.1 cytochrome c family protein [bacterium]